MIKMVLLFNEDINLTLSYSDNLPDTLKYIMEKENIIFRYFYRGRGYFKNKERYYKLLKELSYTKEDLYIITNDESMLSYVDLFNGRNYGIDLFIENCDKDTNKENPYIDVLQTYPNVRLSNNIQKMLLSGVFGGIPIIEKKIGVNK